MAVTKTYLTEAGARAAAYCQMNNIPLVFKYFILSDGLNYDPAQATALMGTLQSKVNITRIKRLNPNSYLLRGEWRNDQIEQMLPYRELGLFCINPENEDEVILYAYGNSTNDGAVENLEPYTTTGHISTRIIDFSFYVKGAEATFYVDDTQKADVVTVQELRDDLEQEIEDRKNAIIDIEHGGTGATTPKEAEFNIIGDTEELTTEINDGAKMYFKQGDPSKTKGSFFVRDSLLFWDYIKRKIKKVLGLDETTYKGNSASADIAKASISSQVRITTYDETKPYALLASFKDQAASNNDMNFVFLAVRESVSGANSGKNFFLMNINTRWSKDAIGWLKWECLYSTTGENPDLTLTYKHTPGTDMQFEIRGKFNGSYQQWRIIPIINSSGDYGSNALSVHKWTYRNVRDTGSVICVTSPTENLPDIAEMTNPTSPVIHGKADGLTKTLTVAEGGTGATTAKAGQYQLLNNINEVTDTASEDVYFAGCYMSPNASTGVIYKRKGSTVWSWIQSKIASVLGLTSSTYKGKASTAGTADTAKACSGNAATADTAKACSGNAATADTAKACSGNAATATTATNDSKSQAIISYIRGLSISGKTITYTKGDGTTGTLTTQDTNTTYSAATQSANGLMSASDKKKLDGIATGANAYTHPTTSGNKHIPSGGSSGQILGYSADGTAVWKSLDTALSTSSTNPVTNKAIATAINTKLTGSVSFVFKAANTAGGRQTMYTVPDNAVVLVIHLGGGGGTVTIGSGVTANFYVDGVSKNAGATISSSVAAVANFTGKSVNLETTASNGGTKRLFVRVY